MEEKIENKETNDLLELIAQCHGTEQYWKHWLGILYTDGIKMMCEKAKSFWLITAIASYNRKEPFQVWTLNVSEDSTAKLTMDEGYGDGKILETQNLEYTDFPQGEWKFYLIDGILILPSEY